MNAFTVFLMVSPIAVFAGIMTFFLVALESGG